MYQITYRLCSILLYQGVILLSVLTMACQEKPHQNQSRDVSRHQILAQVGPNLITLEDFQRVLQEMPPEIRRQYTTLARKKELLADLIQFEIMVLEAQRQSLDNTPKIQDIRKRAATKLLIQRLTQTVSPVSISDAELTRYYRKHLRIFQLPERRRIRHISFIMPPNSTAETWSKRHAQIQALMPKIAAASSRPKGFIEMLHQHSEDPDARKNDGDLGYSAATHHGGNWPQVLSDAAFQIPKIGQIAGPIRTERGYIIIRLEDIVPPLAQPISQVRPIIQQRLLEQKRLHIYREYIKQLRQKFPIKINQQLLAQIPYQPKKRKPQKPLPRTTPSIPLDSIPSTMPSSIPSTMPSSIPSTMPSSMPGSMPSSKPIKD
jgi:parvulin-like peptidyl-prolyl isomerase